MRNNRNAYHYFCNVTIIMVRIVFVKCKQQMGKTERLLFVYVVGLVSLVEILQMISCIN